MKKVHKALKRKTFIIFKYFIYYMDNIMRSQNPFSRNISTGFKNLDTLLLGLRKGDLNIIASKPGIGKTLFALTMFINITGKDTEALYISFEKKEIDLMKDIVTIRGNINKQKMDNGFIVCKDYKIILDMMSSIANDKAMFLKSFYNTNINQLRDYIKEKIYKNKIKIVFIDYLTMILPVSSFTSINEQLSEMCRSLKSLAMEFKIPIVVLCPVKESIEMESSETSDMSDMSIFDFEADRIISIYSDKNDNFENNNYKRFVLYVAKNKHGPRGKMDLYINYINNAVMTGQRQMQIYDKK